MFRYVLALLIINTYGRGLGIPLPEQIADSLEKLAKHCDIEFLSHEIRSRKDDCNVKFMKPYSEKQFQCLLFYDINMQMCLQKNVMMKEDDFKTKMKENLNTAELCGVASWNITNLSDYPSYKPAVSKIVDTTVSCNKLCSEDDIFSLEANFYCKYYYWGSSLLRSLNSLPAQPVNGEINSILPVVVEQNATKTLDLPVAQSVEESALTDIKQTEKEFQHLDKTLIKTAEMPAAKTETNPGTLNVTMVKDKNTLAEVANLQTSSNAQMGTENLNEGKISKDQITGTHSTIKPLNSQPSKFAAPVEEEPPKKSADVDVEAEKPSEIKETVLENPKLKQPSQNVDYQDGDLDSDEGKEGMLDQNIDDGDDPVVADFEQKPSLDKLTTLKKFETAAVASSFDSDIAQRELFPNTDGFSDGDDDNFFPFFLTGVILVIVLYVLYHNKSKVSKVVLGLIVEGRQTGRRRNSRGHSYRRLDTLEQAMSSNTAAAPSRIIY